MHLFKFFLLLLSLLFFSASWANAQDTEEENHNVNELDEVINNYRLSSEAAVATKKVNQEYDEMIRMPDSERFGSGTYADNIRLILKPLQKESDEKLIQLMNRELNKHPNEITKWLIKKEGAKVYLTKVIKHPTALVNLVKIVDDHKRLLHYLFWFLGTILFSFFFKIVFYRSNQSLIERLFFILFRFGLVNGVRAYLFWYYFQFELKPFLDMRNI